MVRFNNIPNGVNPRTGNGGSGYFEYNLNNTLGLVADIGGYANTRSGINDKANDTFERRYTVISNGGGNFTVREQDHGSFVTIAGPSPGACETTPHHGAFVSAGIAGDIQGSAVFTVNSATYNPNGCDANPSVCSTRSGFVSAVFGPGAVSTITFTAFNFEYSSSDQSLAYHHWQDKSDQAVNDKFEGDIANQ